MINEVKTIFFDFDGVLGTSIKKISNGHLVGISEDIFSKTAKEAKKEMADEYRFLATREDERKYMRNFFKLVVKKLQLDETYIDLLLENHFASTTTLYPGIFEFLLEIKARFKIGLLTNALPSRRKYAVQNLGLDKIIDDNLVIISAEVGLWKPEIEIFEFAIRQSNTDPQNILFVDDRLENLKAARETGIKHLFLISEDTSVEDSTIVKISNVLELKKYI